MALEKELAVFNQRLPEFKAEHQGKFVLIHGDEVVDFFSSYDDAIKAGYTKVQIGPVSRKANPSPGTGPVYLAIRRPLCIVSVRPCHILHFRRAFSGIDR
jgi:hypothetical protein